MMKNGWSKWVAGTLAVFGMCSLLSAAEPPQPPDGGHGGPGVPPAPKTLKCPKCGCEIDGQMMRAPEGPRQGGPGMHGRQQGMQRGMRMRRLPFDVKALSEAELARFLTLGKNVRQALEAFRKDGSEANRAALTKAAGELFDFVQAQKIKTLEKKLAEAKAETGKKDELVKADVERMIRRAANRPQRGPEGRGPEGRGPEGREPRNAPREF